MSDSHSQQNHTNICIQMWATHDGTGLLILWRAQGYPARPRLSSRGRLGLAGAKFGSRIRKTDICKHSLDRKCRDCQYMFLQNNNVTSGIKRKHNRSSSLFQLEQDPTQSIPCPRDEEKVTQRQLSPAPLSLFISPLFRFIDLTKLIKTQSRFVFMNSSHLSYSYLKCYTVLQNNHLGN